MALTPTMLLLSRTNPDTGDHERTKLEVPGCPIFDFDRRNDTEEVRAHLAAGWRIVGHIDGKLIPVNAR